MSLVAEFWAFSESAKEILAATLYSNDASFRESLCFGKGSAVAPFIYTLF